MARKNSFEFDQILRRRATGGLKTLTIGNRRVDDGNGVYTQIQRPDLGTNYVEWKLDCTSNAWTNGSGPGEVPSGPYHIVVDLITHWYKQTVVVYRWRETITVWAINEGSVTLTPIN